MQRDRLLREVLEDILRMELSIIKKFNNRTRVISSRECRWVMVHTAIVSTIQMKVQLSKMILIMKIYHWNTGMNTSLKMGLYTEDNGGELLDMDMVYKFGLMELDMKENGKITKLMEKENSGMWMEMYLMVNGVMIKPMAMVFTLM